MSPVNRNNREIAKSGLRGQPIIQKEPIEILTDGDPLMQNIILENEENLGTRIRRELLENPRVQAVVASEPADIKKEMDDAGEYIEPETPFDVKEEPFDPLAGVEVLVDVITPIKKEKSEVLDPAKLAATLANLAAAWRKEDAEVSGNKEIQETLRTTAISENKETQETKETGLEDTIGTRSWKNGVKKAWMKRAKAEKKHEDVPVKKD